MEAAIRATIEALKEEIPHEAPAPLAVGRFDANLMNCYVITDYHLGALSWGEETGADWDLKIAEDTLVAWFSRAIEQSPAAETALLAQISDFLHWDGFDPVTPAHRNLLDADTRFSEARPRGNPRTAPGYPNAARQAPEGASSSWPTPITILRRKCGCANGCPFYTRTIRA